MTYRFSLQLSSHVLRSTEHISYLRLWLILQSLFKISYAVRSSTRRFAKIRHSKSMFPGINQKLSLCDASARWVVTSSTKRVAVKPSVSNLVPESWVRLLHTSDLILLFLHKSRYVNETAANVFTAICRRQRLVQLLLSPLLGLTACHEIFYCINEDQLWI